jgi:hypothetical protein
MLQHEVNWTPGQTIVLATTSMKDSREWHRNELAVVEKVIQNPVTGVRAAVFLEKPVVYQQKFADIKVRLAFSLETLGFRETLLPSQQIVTLLIAFKKDRLTETLQSLVPTQS